MDGRVSSLLWRLDFVLVVAKTQIWGYLWLDKGLGLGLGFSLSLGFGLSFCLGVGFGLAFYLQISLG